MTRKKRILVVTRRVYNFHKDNLLDIGASLLVNFGYSFFAMTVVTFISLKNDVGVFIGQGIYYTLLSLLFSRPSYKTVYGKVLFVLSLWAGGFTAYIYCNDMLSFVINLVA